MIIAAVEGNWMVPLVVVVFGFLNWLSSKSKPGTPPPASFPRPTTTAKPRSPGSEEEERTRKFLEALGLPADASAPPSARQEPRPPIVSRKPTRPATPRPAQPPPALPRSPVFKDLETVPAAPAAPTFSPELVVLTTPELVTVSSTIGAIPAEAVTGPTIAIEVFARGEELRRALTSPAQLRSAFLVREILGPPRSLQS